VGGDFVLLCSQRCAPRLPRTTYICLGYMRVTLSPSLSLLPSSCLAVLSRPRGWGVSCTLPRMRCCRWREVRFETGAVGSEVGDGLIQDAAGCLDSVAQSRV
jgi:hypothetical protein